MRRNKLLALILTLCMLFTTLGSVSIASAEGEITLAATYDVGQGSSFSLPGGTVVNTENVGYQILSETVDTVTNYYRVNVGTYQNLVSEDFDNLEVGVDPNNMTEGGFTIYGSASTESTVDVAYENGTSGNKVLELGKDQISWNKSSSFVGLSLGDNNDNYTGSFQFRGKIKFCSYSVNDSVFAIITNNRMGYEIDYTFGGMYFNQTSVENLTVVRNTVGVNTSTTKYPDIIKNVNVKNNTGEWLEFRAVFDLSSKTYDIYAGDMATPVIADRPYQGTATDVAAVSIVSRDNTSSNLIQFDELALEKLVYPSEITQTSFAASVYTGVTSGSVAVPVTMSDGTAQTFDAAYTLTEAQASTAGTYNVSATIPGFTDTVAVAVTVVDNSKATTVNTYVGAEYTLPVTVNGTAVTAWTNYSGEPVTEADTSVMGRRLYTATLSDGSVVAYAVNVGEYLEKLSDDMSDHTATTYETTGIETILPGTGDGLTLTMNNDGKNSATLKTSGTNKYINFNGKTSSDSDTLVNTPVANARWTVKDSFNGDYKVSYDVKLENASNITSDNADTAYFPYTFQIYDPAGNMISAAGLYVNKSGKLGMRGQIYSSSLTNVDITSAAEWKAGSDGLYSSKWLTVDIIVHTAEQTYDILVDGTPTHTGLQFAGNLSTHPTDGTLGSIRAHCRSVTAACDAMIDNLKVYTYNCVADNFDEDINIVTAVGSNTPEVQLSLTNGGMADFGAVVDCDVSNPADYTDVDAQIEGIDGTVKADVRVANYHIHGVNLTSDTGEFVTYPVAKGSVASVVVTKLTDSTAEDMIVVQSDSSDNIKAVKLVDISTLAKGVRTEVATNMTLADDTQAGDLINIYVWDDMDSITPVDMVTDVTFDYTAAPAVFVAGDSTYETYPRTANPSQWPKTGIGQVLANYFSSAVEVNNYAKSGATTFSFIDDGLWKSVINNGKTGDYVIVSFGHNDQTKCTSDPCVYGTNLEKFIDEARTNGMNIIMATPVTRRDNALELENCSKDFDSTAHKHITQMKDICAAEGVPCIDMETLSTTLVTGLGTTESTKLYMVDLTKNSGNYSSAEAWETSRYNPDGAVADTAYTTDNSHFTIYGANVYAQMLAQQIKDKNIILSNFVDADKIAAEITYPALDLE